MSPTRSPAPMLPILTKNQALWSSIHIRLFEVPSAVSMSLNEMTEFWENLGQDQGKEADRRIRGRIRQESLVCSHGPVLDLSAGGVRIVTSRKLEGPVALTLSDGTNRLEVAAHVSWIKRRGLFKHEVGLRFLDLTDQDKRTIGQMTMRNCVRRSFHGDAA